MKKKKPRKILCYRLANHVRLCKQSWRQIIGPGANFKARDATSVVFSQIYDLRLYPSIIPFPRPAPPPPPSLRQFQTNVSSVTVYGATQKW